jgi:ribonuclease HI
MGSDHLPIRLSLGGVQLQETPLGEVKYDYSKADWAGFKQQLQSATYPTETNDVDKWYQELRQIILQAADGNIPKKCVNANHKHKANAWWNSKCKQKQSELRRAYRCYKKCQSEETYTDLKNKRISFKKTIAESKINYWKHYVDENVQDYKDTGKIWKKVLKLKRRYNPTERPLLVNGNKTTTLKEKANVLANMFARTSQTESLADDVKEYRQRIEQNFSEPATDNFHPINVIFSKQEFDSALKSITNPKKATGADALSYQMILQLTENAKTELLGLFQRCWALGTIPAMWKQATVTALHKQGKPRSNPSSYRPISLTPHTGKVYERLIKGRLEHFLESKKVIPNFQAGFRKKRGCTDHIVKLTAHVKKAIIKKRAVFATFFDIKSAYDSVWHGMFLHKLKLLNISGNMYNFFKTFLSGRSFEVKVGSFLSEKRYINMGLPQGSAISPLAFNIMLHDIGRIQLKDSTMTLYADDLACWHSPDFRRINRDFTINKTKETIQKNVDEVIKYMKENGFQLAAEKTVFVVFTNNRLEIENYSIDVEGHKISPSKSVKYLGVIFDCKLTWKEHIEYLLSKTNSVWNLIKLIKHEPGLGHPKTLTNLVRALVRSRLSYGQEAFYSAAPSLLKRLESRESHFLKIALGIAKHADPLLMYRELGLSPLNRERELRTAQYVIKANATENSTSLEVMSDFNDIESVHYQNRLARTPTIGRRGQPIHSYTKELIDAAKVNPSKIEKQPRPNNAPWLLERADIITSISDDTKADNPLKVTMLAKERLATEYNNYLQVFTDGSKLSNGQVGSAFVMPASDISGKFRITNEVSVFSAEIFAIYQALCHLVSEAPAKKEIVILSDSKSALQTLCKQHNPNRTLVINECLYKIHCLKQKGYTISLCWIPSHVNIRGNELADQRAKEAATLPTITHDIGLTLSETFSKLKEASTKMCQREFYEHARTKGWELHEQMGRSECPRLPQNLYPLLYRLKTRALKCDHITQFCTCGQALNFEHIFTCSFIHAELKGTFAQLNKLGMHLMPATVTHCESLRRWKLIETLLRDLTNSTVGHLI